MNHDEHDCRDPLESEFEDLGSATIEPPVWVIRNLLPSGITFLAGPPKSRKSSLEMILALLATDHLVEVLPPEFKNKFTSERTGIVMGWSAEATAGELRHMVESGLGVKVKDDRSILIAKDPFQYRLDDPDALPRMLEWLNQYQPVMFFIDPLRDFHNLDEKDDGSMNRLLRPLQRWAKRHDSAMLVVHHARKRQDMKDKNHILSPEDMRGTSALFGMADAVLMVTPQEHLGITISASFKRAEAWSLTFQLGMWGQPSGINNGLVVDDVVYQTYKSLRAGAVSAAAIATQLHVRKHQVQLAVAALVKAGVATRDGRTMNVEPQDAAMSAAFETWRKHHGEARSEEEGS